MDIPSQITRNLCDAERFCYGLKLLAEETNMSSIIWSNLGVETLKFADGSSVGSLRAFKEAGLVRDEQ